MNSSSIWSYSYSCSYMSLGISFFVSWRYPKDFKYLDLIIEYLNEKAYLCFVLINFLNISLLWRCIELHPYSLVLLLLCLFILLIITLLLLLLLLIFIWSTSLLSLLVSTLASVSASGLLGFASNKYSEFSLMVEPFPSFEDKP